MRPLLELDTGRVIAGGLFPDLTPNQTSSGNFNGTVDGPAVWAGGQNVLFESNGAQKLLGVTNEGNNLGDVIRGIVQAGQIAPTIYTMANSTVLRYDGVGTPPVNLTQGVVGAAGPWSLTTWGDWAILTSVNTGPLIYKPGDAHAFPLTGALNTFHTATFVKKLKNFVMFYRTNNASEEVVWSELGDPEMYDPVEGGYAGSLVIRDFDSPISAVQPLVGTMGIYSQDALIVQSYGGLPNVWEFSDALRGIGAVSDGAIIPVGRLHYGLGPNGFFQTDGNSFRYIDEPMVAKWYRDMADPAQRSLTTGFNHKLRRMACWFFPCKDGVIRGLGFKYSENIWTVLNVPVTASSDESQYDYPIVALGTNWGFYDKVGNASQVVAELYSRPFDATKPENFKRWDLLRTQMFEQVGQVQVRFGFSDRPVTEDEITDWSEWQDLAYENWITRESPYITMHLRSSGADAQWRLGGLTLLGEVQGYRV